MSKCSLSRWIVAIGIAVSIPSIALASFASDNSFFEDLKEKFKKGTLLLRKIESSLENQQESLSGIRDAVKETKRRLEGADTKIQTLNSQLRNLQNLEKTSIKKLLGVRRQIASRENEILIIKETLNKKRKEKRALVQKMELFGLYRESFEAPQGLASLSILLAFDNVGEGLRYDYFTSLVQTDAYKLFKETDTVERELSATSRQFQEKIKGLKALQKNALAEMRNLQLHKEAKKRLLALTKGQEEIYEDLLEKSRDEQEEVTKVIQHLRENSTFVEKKLDELKENELLSDTISIEDFEEALRNIPFETSAEFRWSVSPIRGISAYFHDEDYKKTMGIPHNAIDIRIPQETPVKAAATGVVYKIQDEDTGYNYAILAHRDGFLTLYGHLTKITVKENDTVFSGQTIGYSGGIPGTRGAGWLTTGAHLHFEAFKDWKHVDPLEYLALEFLPIEYIPQKYLLKLSGGEIENKISRITKKKVRRIDSLETLDSIE